MVQYEPEYSPQAWKDFRKHKRRREFWLTRFFLKYRYWFSGIIITGILIVIFRGFSPSIPVEETNVIPQDSGSVYDPESEKTEGVPVPERPVILSHVNSRADTAAGKENISFNYLPIRINDSLPANYDNRIQIKNKIKGIPDSIEIVPARSDFLREKGLGNQSDNSQLIPLQLKSVKVPDLTSHISDRTGKSKLQLPELSSLTTQYNNYKKFTGPNKFALFYSTEVHHSDSIKTFGISQGFGIVIEGPIRSFISISAGLSYQSVNFNKTIFSGQVEDSIPPWTSLVDSIVILSGSYKYLELPVSFNLRFLKSARSQVWLGTGISLMSFSKQKYTYETIVKYRSKNEADIFSNAQGNVHQMASLNFGLLYRFKFTDRIFLNSAIQYKLHLSALGSNSMKLNRLNLQVGLGYRFGRYD